MLKVALSVDHWHLDIVSSLLKNSEVSIVVRVNEINCSYFPVEVTVKRVHNWLKLGRNVKFDSCQMAQLSQVDKLNSQIVNHVIRTLDGLYYVFDFLATLVQHSLYI